MFSIFQLATCTLTCTFDGLHLMYLDIAHKANCQKYADALLAAANKPALLTF